jgi:hypothetical protein
MFTEPETRELHANLSVSMPISVLVRLQPYANRRAKSEFITQAVRRALDDADQDREAKAS